MRQSCIKCIQVDLIRQTHEYKNISNSWLKQPFCGWKEQDRHFPNTSSQSRESMQHYMWEMMDFYSGYISEETVNADLAITRPDTPGS